MRRTRPKVVWLPNTNANSIADGRGTAQIFSLDVGGAVGSFVAGEIPIVIDNSGDPIGVEDISLSDIFNSGYRLRRIVGKIYCSYTSTASDTPSVILVHAGLIIRRNEPASGTSFALLTANASNFSPSEIDNASDPWIWRRSWILRNSLATAQSALHVGASAINYGAVGASAVDGPHVDVKTGRIVSQEERLVLDVSATNLSNGDQQQVNIMNVIADLRVLATLKTSVGNRRNASR